MLWQRVCDMVHRHFPAIAGTKTCENSTFVFLSPIRSDRHPSHALADLESNPDLKSPRYSDPTLRRCDAITRQPCRQYRGHSSQRTILPIVFRHSQRHVSFDSHSASSASLLVVSPSFCFLATELLHRVSVVLVSTLISFPISASLYFPPARSFPTIQTDFYS